MIGREYRIIGELYAYGVRQDLQDTDASFVTLTSLGISGPEIVFKRKLPIGQTFRIRGAMYRFVLLDNGNEYLIEMPGADLPQGVEVRLPLLGGNGNSDGELNPQLYQQVVQ
jgi:hypothetical protein